MEPSPKKKRRGVWYELGLSPMTLMRMVIRGEAKIIGKARGGAYVYELKK